MGNRFTNIGERIELKLKELNMRQVDICEKTGLSKNAISNYINNIRIPDTKACYKISQALFVSMEWLLTGEDKRGCNQVDSCEKHINTDYASGQQLERLDKGFAAFECTERERKLILSFRKLDDLDKEMVENTIKIIYKRIGKVDT